MTWIQLAGCDDVTYLAIVDLTDSELKLLETIAKASKNVGGGCSPVMFVGDDHGPYIEPGESEPERDGWTKWGTVPPR